MPKKGIKGLKSRKTAKKKFNKIARSAARGGATNPDAVAASVFRKAGKGRLIGRKKAKK